MLLEKKVCKLSQGEVENILESTKDDCWPVTINGIALHSNVGSTVTMGDGVLQINSEFSYSKKKAGDPEMVGTSFSYIGNMCDVCKRPPLSEKAETDDVSQDYVPLSFAASYGNGDASAPDCATYSLERSTHGSIKLWSKRASSHSVPGLSHRKPTTAEIAEIIDSWSGDYDLSLSSNYKQVCMLSALFNVIVISHNGLAEALFICMPSVVKDESVRMSGLKVCYCLLNPYAEDLSVKHILTMLANYAHAVGFKHIFGYSVGEVVACLDVSSCTTHSQKFSFKMSVTMEGVKNLIVL